MPCGEFNPLTRVDDDVTVPVDGTTVIFLIEPVLGDPPSSVTNRFTVPPGPGDAAMDLAKLGTVVSVALIVVPEVASYSPIVSK